MRPPAEQWESSIEMSQDVKNELEFIGLLTWLQAINQENPNFEQFFLFEDPKSIETVRQ